MVTNPKTIHPATSGKACLLPRFFTKFYYTALNITGIKINVDQNNYLANRITLVLEDSLNWTILSLSQTPRSHEAFI